MISFTILGEPHSKANSRQLVYFGSRPAFIKSKPALRFEKAAIPQVPLVTPLIDSPVRITCRIWYASERPDLDPSVILDVMQGRVYTNDRRVRELHCYHGIDRVNPRAEVEVEEIKTGREIIEVCARPGERLRKSTLGWPERGDAA